jgi:hypothetical protein
VTNSISSTGVKTNMLGPVTFSTETAPLIQDLIDYATLPSAAFDVIYANGTNTDYAVINWTFTRCRP